jgi:hypothetical protein
MNMSKTVFDHLTEQIDSVVKGRRYIIAEIGKLKSSIDDLKDSVEKSQGGGSNVGATINDLKGFMQKMIAALGEMKNSIGQVGGLVKSLTGSVQTLQQSGGARPMPQQQQYQQPSPQQQYQQPAPQYQQPAPQQQYQQPAPQYQQPAPQYQQPAPQQQYQQPAPAAAPAAGAAGQAFDRVLQAAESQTPAKDLGGMLDALRTSLSKSNPLNPILFELSMEAGRLKSLGGNPLDPAGIDAIRTKIDKWKSKS